MIIDEIIENKRKEVTLRKKARLQDSFLPGLRKSKRSFYEALKKQGVGFIFECKKKSPSMGLIRPNFDLVSITKDYSNWADAISVLADKKYFDGSLENIKIVSDACNLPVLCKDFIIDPYQVYEARAHGADAILLMLSVIDNDTWKKCKKAADEFNIDVLTEVHNEEELNRAQKLNAPIIGINNRDFTDLSVDINTTVKLAPKLDSIRSSGCLIISESGISKRKDVKKLRGFVDGFLIGTSVMKEKSISQACKKLVYGSVKVCGLTSVKDAKMVMEAGAVYGGLIFYEKSARCVTIETAGKIIKSCELKFIGVFVNEDIDKVVQIARDLSLWGVQLHGDETPDDIAELRKLLPAIKIIKAVRIPEGDIATAVSPDLDKETRNIATAVSPDFILLDTYQKGVRGGTGKNFDWSFLKDKNLNKIILSGGLSPRNAAKADNIGAAMLDVNSGVEESPGIKSKKLLDKFFNALKGKQK